MTTQFFVWSGASLRMPDLRRRKSRPMLADKLRPRIVAILQERPGPKGVSIARRLGVPFHGTLRGVLAKMRQEGLLVAADLRQPGYRLAPRGVQEIDARAGASV